MCRHAVGAKQRSGKDGLNYVKYPKRLKVLRTQQFSKTAPPVGLTRRD